MTDPVDTAIGSDPDDPLFRPQGNITAKCCEPDIPMRFVEIGTAPRVKCVGAELRPHEPVRSSPSTPGDGESAP